jgi:hypothetical protein
LIAYNLTAAPGQDSLSVFVRQTMAGPPTSLPAHAYGAIIVGVPLAAGGCNPNQCTVVQRAWGLLILVGLMGAGWLAWRALRRPNGDHLRAWGQLALVLAAALSMAAYLGSSSAAMTPWESARYLSCLPVSFPAMVWPLTRIVPHGQSLMRAVLATTVAMAVLAAPAWGTAALIRSADQISRAAARQQQLIDALTHERMTQLYADYWTCHRLSFATSEHIACAVVGDDLRPGWDRYRPLRERVWADPHPGYAFPVASSVDHAFRSYVDNAKVPYRVVEAAGYHVYQLSAAVGVPLGRESVP